MKTIFFSIYDGDQEKIFLRSDFLGHLKRDDVRIILLVRSGEKNGEKIEYYKKEFGGANFIVEPIPAIAMNRRASELYWYHICWNSIPSFTTRLKRHDLFLKHKNFARYALESIVGILGYCKSWRSLLRWIYMRVPDDYCKNLFEQYKPDILFAPSMFSPEDNRLLRMAKRMGVKTVTCMKSWDVPTTRGFSRVKADRILVFNEINKKETMDLADYEEDRVRIIGFPQFDVYKRSEIFVTREEFFKKIGADLDKKLVLFAIPGDFKHEFINDIVQGLDKAIEDKKIVHPVQVLARFHPKYPSPAERLKTLKNYILDRPGKYFSASLEMGTDAPLSKTFQWTFTTEDIVHLANSLRHCDVMINVESTMTLDATMLDKPTIMIAYDGNRQLDYWHSVRRNYDREHFRAVLASGGSCLARSEEELIMHINEYLEHPEKDAEGRERMRKTVLFSTDGKSGKRAAEYVLEVLDS